LWTRVNRHLTTDPNPTQVEFSERLIHKTASLHVTYVDEEFEDLVSILRIEAWRACSQ
jgi:hypothetical protein